MSRSLSPRFGAIITALLGVLAGCGISTDDQPRDVLASERPIVPTTAADGSAQPGSGAIVFFVGPPGEAATAPLVGVGRSDAADATALLTTLLEGPTDNEQTELGLRTAIPTGTVLLATSLDSQGTLTVDLGADFLASAGDVLLDAVAQLVFTATRTDGARRVRLLIEGEPQDWPTSSGTSTRDPLSIYDFLDRPVNYANNDTAESVSTSSTVGQSS